MKQQHRCKVSEIAVSNEGHVARDRDPTQGVHGAHAECRQDEPSGAKAYAIDDRQVAHPISFRLDGNLRDAWAISTHRRSCCDLLAILASPILDSRDNEVGLERPT